MKRKEMLSRIKAEKDKEDKIGLAVLKFMIVLQMVLFTIFCLLKVGII